MIQALKQKYSLIIVVLIIFYSVGIAGFQFNLTQDIFISLTPFTLLLSFVILLFFHQAWNRNFIIVSLIIVLCGFFVEVVGVKTGLIFGEYKYGQTLGIKLFETPLMIGINWLMLSYCTFLIFKNTALPRFAKPFLAAFLMLSYDIALEPVAIKYDMWSWANVEIPLKNYLAWFLISFVFQLILLFTAKKWENKIAAAIFAIQFFFFIMLNVFLYFNI